MKLTPPEIGDAVRARLDAWDRTAEPFRLDVDIDGCRLQLADERVWVYVEYITVPERRGGYGTAIMSALTAWADQHRLRLDLGVSTEYGTPARTLTRFYSRHGFTGRPSHMTRVPNPRQETNREGDQP